MTLTPPIPQDELGILQEASKLVVVADSAYQYIEEAAIALRLNTAANEGHREYTTNKALTKTTLDKLKELGYKVKIIGESTEIRLPEKPEVT